MKLKLKYKKPLSFLVALCLVAGLVPLLSVPVQAADYWVDWTEIRSRNIVASSAVNLRTLTGNFKVTTDTTIATPSWAGWSGLTISGTATIYIASGVKLTVNGQVGSGVTGGGAGILLLEGATLILRGEGRLEATGGRAGNGTNGSTGGNGFPTPQGSQNPTSTHRWGGNGGAGGGGAGAGIGGNGGNGGAGSINASNANDTNNQHPLSGFTGSNGNAGNAMGTLYVLDSVEVDASGGANGTRGTGGVAASDRANHSQLFFGGTGGGGGGGRGVLAAGIGGGGAGGGSGGSSGLGGILFNGTPANASGGSGGAPNGQGGGAFTARTPVSNAGNNAGLINGGAAVSGGGSVGIQSNGMGGRGGNVGTGGAGGTVFVASTATIGTIGGGNTENGEGEAATINAQNIITFNANGGSLENIPAAQELFYGENITAEIPTRPGFTFTGWNTAQDGKGTDYAPGAAFSANENIMLYAQWSSNFSANANDNTINFSVDTENLENDLLNVLINHIITEDHIQNQNLVTLTLNVNETDDTATGAEEIIETTRGRMLQFFRITVQKQINNDEPIPLTELPAPVQITIDLSEELSGRTGYTVYRFHGGGVQQLGMDTDAEEFFTVSRGTGENDTDQVIIHTMRFSTYAVVENIRTIDELPSKDDVDVQARIVDLTTPVYKIDIAWGDMKFVFYPDEFAGTWNPEELEYEGAMAAGWHGFEDGNNEIIVRNHSNADVRVSFTVSDNEFDGNVNMNVNQVNDNSDNPAVDMELRRVPSQLADTPSINAFLRIKGEPSADDIENFADVWHRVGIITVTITPDGDDLTPR